MAARVEILGIRHHGPGSARSVAGALADLDPDLILIEGAPELDALIELAGDPDLVPPVAGLVYATDRPSRAAFYPLATFSPEWVALRWAVGRGVEVHFADLPAVNALADPRPDDESDHAADPDGIEPDDQPRGRRVDHGRSVDPIDLLARVAGYDDPERWWEDAIEHRAESTHARFALLREAMASARADPADEDPRTLRREAAMRRVLRKSIKDGRQRIAFVCGAYHAPVLHPDNFPTATSDNRLLTKLPRIKVTATWAPWTAGRLATASGYGAGVTSPGWYQHLYGCWEQDRPEDVVPGWLTRVARTLREEGMDAAPATVVEAARLAEALAAIRGRPSVGLSELTHATQAVLCEGSALPLKLIERTLVVGEQLGQVPESAPLVPLAQDLAKLQRSTRLKPSAEQRTITLDLRKDSQRARSLLLHRLNLLDIDWGRQVEVGTTGTFKEAWELQWRPEFAVGLVEAGLYGTTVVSACENKIIERSREATHLATLGGLIESTLIADLPEAMASIIDALAAATAHQHDTLELLRAVEPLARTQRYGDVRGADTAVVADVLQTVIIRAAAGLRAACASLDDDAALAMRTAIDQAHRGVGLVGVATEEWRRALRTVAVDDRVHGLVTGRVNRLLLDSGDLDPDTAASRLSRRLSRGSVPAQAAGWLDGFLEGEALLLLHDHQLLGLIDDWVAGIDATTFDDLLPLLRRTFSRFEPAERRQIGSTVRRIGNESDAAAADGPVLDLDRGWPVLRRVAELLQVEVS